MLWDRRSRAGGRRTGETTGGLGEAGRSRRSESASELGLEMRRRLMAEGGLLRTDAVVGMRRTNAGVGVRGTNAKVGMLRTDRSVYPPP